MITAGRSLHAIGIFVEEIRCTKCNKKLAEADYRQLAIKCPRCGTLNNLKAVEPLLPLSAVLLERKNHVRPSDP